MNIEWTKIIIETLVTSLITALIGGAAALWFYQRKIERKHKLDTILKFKASLGKALDEAAVVFNRSKPVMEALRRLWGFKHAGWGGGEVDKLLQEVIEAMYDDVSLKYDILPILSTFSSTEERPSLDKDTAA